MIISLSDVWFSHYTHLPINLFSHSNDSEQGSFLFQKNGSKTHFFFQIDNTLPDSNVLHNGRGEGEAQTGIFKACLNSLSGKLCGSDHQFKRSLNLNSILGFHRHCLVCTFFYINVIVVVILQSLILHGLSHQGKLRDYNTPYNGLSVFTSRQFIIWITKKIHVSE